VTVAEHGGFAACMEPVRVNKRVLAGEDDLYIFQSRALKAFSYKLGGTRDVVLVFGKGANTRDAQKFRQLVKKTRFIFVYKWLDNGWQERSLVFNYRLALRDAWMEKTATSASRFGRKFS
jgi:hypothetical protein